MEEDRLLSPSRSMGIRRWYPTHLTTQRRQTCQGALLTVRQAQNQTRNQLLSWYIVNKIISYLTKWKIQIKNGNYLFNLFKALLPMHCSALRTGQQCLWGVTPHAVQGKWQHCCVEWYRVNISPSNIFQISLLPARFHQNCQATIGRCED